ncbi:MAG: glycine cleavage system aminomethyltransferase GcvT [Spirochaetes bacterium]|nr:glycine cleavage system aminomethyltransferase GcvT [Spirochaetota bacterium]
MKQTPFIDHHNYLKAKMVEFGGYNMPVLYTSIIDEHKAVRDSAGIFDISHMSRIRISGKQALEAVSFCSSNDPRKLNDSQAQYSLILNDRAIILDDILVYRTNEEDFLIVANAEKTKVVTDSLKLFHGDYKIEDLSESLAMIAIQGPKSKDILSTIIPDFPVIEYFHHIRVNSSEVEIMIAKTGYTGEQGYEIIGDPQTLLELMDEAIKKGTVPCGLGARDTLRLEMGYPLWGNDLEQKNPIEAGLMWAVRKELSGFTGSDALSELKDSKHPGRLNGFIMKEKGIPRHGYPVLVNNEKCGVVTSGVFSPSLKYGIGLAFLDKKYSNGQEITISIRDKQYNAEIQKPPFIKTNVKS